MHVDFLSVVTGGFFLMKKPLECVLSVYSNSETAVAATGPLPLRGIRLSAAASALQR